MPGIRDPRPYPATVTPIDQTNPPTICQEGEDPDGDPDRAGQWVEHGADQWDEPGEHDGLGGAVARQGVAGSGNAVLQPRSIGTVQQCRAAVAPDQVADLGAEQCASGPGQQHRRQGQVEIGAGGGCAPQSGLLTSGRTGQTGRFLTPGRRTPQPNRNHPLVNTSPVGRG